MKETLRLFRSRLLKNNNCTSHVEQQLTIIEVRSSYYHRVGEVIDSNYIGTVKVLWVYIHPLISENWLVISCPGVLTIRKKYL